MSPADGSSAEGSSAEGSSRWLCFTCASWNAPARTTCLECLAPRRTLVPLPSDDRPACHRLRGILTVLGYHRNRDGDWEHPSAPLVEDLSLGARGLENEAALVCWFVGQGYARGVREERDRIRQAVGALLALAEKD